MNPDVFSGWTGTNKWVGFWDDEDSRKIDQMFDDLAKTVGFEKRYQKFEKLQEFYIDVVPFIKLGDSKRLQIGHKSLKGFESAPSPVFFNVWLE
jgi:ABC-type transport system substrate-binding protein